MRIVICGSMLFPKEMENIAKILKNRNHEIFLPHGTKDYMNISDKGVDKVEGAQKKIKNDLIRAHYNLIKKIGSNSHSKRK